MRLTIQAHVKGKVNEGGSPLDRVFRMSDLISGKRTTIPSKDFNDPETHRSYA